MSGQGIPLGEQNGAWLSEGDEVEGVVVKIYAADRPATAKRFDALPHTRRIDVSYHETRDGAKLAATKIEEGGVAEKLAVRLLNGQHFLPLLIEVSPATATET